MTILKNTLQSSDQEMVKLKNELQTVPVNKELLTGTVPVIKDLLVGTVPVNKKLLTGRDPVNTLFHSQIAHQTEQLLQKKFFDSMFGLESEKMTALRSNQSLTFIFYVTFSSSIQN